MLANRSLISTGTISVHIDIQNVAYWKLVLNLVIGIYSVKQLKGSCHMFKKVIPMYTILKVLQSTIPIMSSWVSWHTLEESLALEFTSERVFFYLPNCWGTNGKGESAASAPRMYVSPISSSSTFFTREKSGVSKWGLIDFEMHFLVPNGLINRVRHCCWWTGRLLVSSKQSQKINIYSI